MAVSPMIIPKPMQLNFNMNEHANTLLASMQSLKSENVATDFFVHVGDATFPVHKVVLITFSDYFRAMLLHDTKEAQEGKVEMKSVEAQAVEQCIHYMYTGDCTVDTCSLEGILYSADMLQLSQVKKICFNHMKTNLSAGNCVFFLRLLEVFTNETLLQDTQEYFRKNITAVGTSDDFMALEWEVAGRYLSDIWMGDLVAWRVGMQWIRYCEPDRGKYVYELVKLLRFVSFPSSELLSSMWNESLFTSHAECVDHIHRRLFADRRDLQNNLTSNNCIFLSVHARRYRQCNKIFQNLIMNFMKAHFGEIMTLAEFATLHKDDMKDLFMNDNTVYFSEAAKWNALVKWINSNHSDESLFRRLLQKVDLDFLPARFINDHVVDSEILKVSNSSSDLMKRLVRREEPIADSIAVIDNSCSLFALNILRCTVQKLSLPEKQGFTLSSYNNAILVSCNKKLCIISNRQLYYFGNDHMWKKLSSLPVQIAYYEKLCVIEFQDCLYIITKAHVHKYSPLKNDWHELCGCNFDKFTATASSNYIYVMDSSNTDIRKFNPNTNTWMSFLPRPNQNMSCIICICGDLYVTNSVTWLRFAPSETSWNEKIANGSLCGINSGNFVTIANKVFDISCSPSKFKLKTLDVSCGLTVEKSLSVPVSFGWPNVNQTQNRSLNSSFSCPRNACAFLSNRSNFGSQNLPKRPKLII